MSSTLVDWAGMITLIVYAGGFVVIARVGGVPVRIHWSFWILLAGYSTYGLMSEGVLAAVSSIGLITMLFFSVLLHEFGHVFAAKRYGISTRNVTLYPFGGVAALEKEMPGAKAEFWVALAGPAVNIALAIPAIVGWWLTGWTGLALFGGVNIVMAVFNLIPAFPMDGGRVFRAALTPILGWVRASKFAIFVGRIFSVLFVGIGVVGGSFSLVFVGLFLLFATSVEQRRLRFYQKQRSQRTRHYPYVTRWTLRPRQV